MTAGTYKITTVAAGDITLTGNVGAGGTCTYQIALAPKVYDPATGAVAIWFATAGKGEVPTGCKSICNYRNRLVLAGMPGQEQNWFMARSGDPLDFLYTDTDALAAGAGGNTDAGKIGDLEKALIPYSDDYLVFGCAKSTWVLRGDPADGGRIDAVNYEVGALDRFSWCFDDQSTLYIMSRQGLYRFTGTALESLSREKVPKELRDISTESYEVAMGWDREQQGVMIFVTQRASGASQHWFYEPTIGAFFPDAIPDAHGPLCCHNYGAALPGYQRLLLGGRDGYVRAYDLDNTGDDGTAISSHAIIGPTALGAPGREGTLNKLDAVLTANTDGLSYEIRSGFTAEASVTASASASGTWTGGGLRGSVRSRVRDNYLCLKLSSSTLGQRWGIESLVATVAQNGQVRKR
jgi:hypothetical protein